VPFAHRHDRHRSGDLPVSVGQTELARHLCTGERSPICCGRRDLINVLINVKGHRYWGRADKIPYDVIVRDDEKTKAEAEIEKQKQQQRGTEGGNDTTPKVKWFSKIETIFVHHAIVPKETLETLLEAEDATNKWPLRWRDREDPQKWGSDYLQRLATDKGFRETECESIRALLAEEDGYDPTKSFKAFLRDPKGAIKVYLERKWGLFWVSIFYPLRRIHMFPIVHARLKDQGPPKATVGDIRDLSRWIEYVKPRMGEDEDHLLFQVARPVIVEDAEFQDRFQGTILLVLIIDIIVPRTPAFVYKHRFYSLIESAAVAAVLDYTRTRDWVDFVREAKTSPADSQFYLEAISRINVQGKDMPEGTILTFGAHVRHAFVKDYEQTGTEAETRKAVVAKEIAIQQGEAKIAAAQRAAKAIQLEIGALAEVYGQMAQRTSPEVVQAYLLQEGLKSYRGDFLSLGPGTGTGVMVPVKTSPGKREETESPPAT